MRAPLWLYPPAFRERYGEEISHLLASSRKPVRDVLDVVWHALLERMELTVPRFFRALPRLFGFAALVVLFAIGAGSVAHFAARQLAARLGATPQTPVAAIVHTVVFTVALAVAVAAVRTGRALAARLAYPTWTVVAVTVVAQIIGSQVIVDPTTKHAWTLPVSIVPDATAVKPTLLFLGAWLVLTLVLVAVVRRLTSRRAIVAAVLGGLVVLQMMAYVDIVMSGYSYLAEGPWVLDYWRSLAGVLVPMRGGGDVMLSDQEWLTTMYTCAVLGYAIALVRRPAMNAVPANAVAVL